MLDFVTRLLSPYQFNPMNFNRLRDVLEQLVDFDVLKRPDRPVKLFLSATNVRTGKVKVFEKDEISVSTALASACLPSMFQVVEIDGEAYRDGGYIGNPALFPPIYKCQSASVLIVHINSLYRSDIPRTPDEISNRINEISFNSSLMRKMRAVSFVTRLITEQRISDPSVRQDPIHSIANDKLMVASTQPASLLPAGASSAIFVTRAAGVRVTGSRKTFPSLASSRRKILTAYTSEPKLCTPPAAAQGK